MVLEQLFGSRTRVKLLRLFLTHPEEQFFVRELTRRVAERINSVRRELANLESLSLVAGVSKNRKRFYRLNTSSILYPELKALILKARIAVEQDWLEKIKKSGRISYLSLSGVFTGVAEAQTDVLIVGRVARKTLRSFMRRFQEQFENEIRFTVMPLKEFKYRRDITDRFLYTIFENKQVVLINRLRSTEKP